MKKYNVNTAMKPHNTIKRSLRPNDKVKPQKMCEGAYSITCKNCNATYIGETKRTLGSRIKNTKNTLRKHRLVDPTPKATEKHRKRDASITYHRSHDSKESHRGLGGGAKFVDRESDWRTRGIKEAIWIRKTKDSMN